MYVNQAMQELLELAKGFMMVSIKPNWLQFLV